MRTGYPEVNGRSSPGLPLGRIAETLALFMTGPLLAVFLGVISPGRLTELSWYAWGHPLLWTVLLVSLTACGYAFPAIVAAYRRLGGFPWRASLALAAGAVNAVVSLRLLSA